ncbi:copper homeostasis protein [Cyclobacterium lianum]|uniref:PF03932 family protein CutC n=1 Tax=Cyclobacterium lianum TaxID=388280 RepID=A0A1M7QS48_9BACT|nr:copper homeostasis protein CutC [Cyclobacterium lianum]SHN34493.1 copper homeostasis protein [Cyclobacterium lianum]
MSSGKIIFEAPVYTVEAALLAVANGVDRLELCADFAEGGTTPSAGLLKVIKQHVSVPVFVMIRCRGGDFLYSDKELQAMQNDMDILGQHGADGFVFGVLTASGEVDSEACQVLLKAAKGKPCTFHRAFDLVPDKEKALEILVSLGFRRILTSGGADNVAAGMGVIKKLATRAAGRIIILPGGGLTSADLPLLHQSDPLQEVHSSGKAFRETAMKRSNSTTRLSLLEETEGKVLTVDPQRIRAFRAALDQLDQI